MSSLVVQAGDLIGSPEKERPFSATVPVKLRLGDTNVDGPMEVTGTLIGQLDSVKADFEVSAWAELVCNRCLTGWCEQVAAKSEHFFTRDPDEDGYGVVDNAVDLHGPATDELALALPSAPLCREGCKGLCPTCGTDLNSDPCDGHGEESPSPFASLKDLFDS